jgi:hypothetical protein
MLLECRGTSTESPEPTRSLEPSVSEGGNFERIWPETSDFHRVLLRAANCFTSAEDFYCRKHPTASAGFELAILGTRGQHANH